MNRILNIDFVRVVILEHVMHEVHGLLQTQKVFVERHEVHIYLGYFVFKDEVVVLEEFIALNGATGDEQDEHFFLGAPSVALEDDLFDFFDFWTDDEHYEGVLWLDGVFVGETNFLFHFGGFWWHPDHKCEEFENRFVHVECFVARPIFKILNELLLVVL